MQAVSWVSRLIPRKMNASYQLEAKKAAECIIEQARYRKRPEKDPIKIYESLSSWEERKIFCLIYELKRIKQMSEEDVLEDYGVLKEHKITALIDRINRMQLQLSMKG